MSGWISRSAGPVARTSLLSRTTATSLRGMTRKKDKKSKRNTGSDEPQTWMDELDKIIYPIEPRPRPSLTPDDLDERAARVKAWQRYTISRARAIEKRQLELCKHRDDALAELKKVDRKRWNQAIEIDCTLWPQHFPQVTDTPPLEGYSAGASVE